MTQKASPIPGDFDVVVNHRVFFVPESTKAEKAAEKVNQMTAGPAVSLDRWPSNCILLVWAVKWNVLGLMPVRPLLVFQCQVNVPAGRALDVMA